MVSQPENQNDVDGVQEGVAETSPSEAAELDTLLREYEGDTKTPDTKTTDIKTTDIKVADTTPSADVAKFAKAVKPVVDFVKKQEAKEAQAEFDTGLKDIMTFFSEEEKLKEFPDELKRGFLETRAQDDPDFKTAFENRAKNPKAWETARETARVALTELVSGLPGSTVRTDVEAAKAAVDGTTDDKPASEEGPSPVKKMAMSDYEWRQYKEEQELLAEAS